jgi:hypothetical protein
VTRLERIIAGMEAGAKATAAVAAALAALAAVAKVLQPEVPE